MCVPSFVKIEGLIYRFKWDTHTHTHTHTHSHTHSHTYTHSHTHTHTDTHTHLHTHKHTHTQSHTYTHIYTHTHTHTHIHTYTHTYTNKTPCVFMYVCMYTASAAQSAPFQFKQVFTIQHKQMTFNFKSSLYSHEISPPNVTVAQLAYNSIHAKRLFKSHFSSPTLTSL